MSNIMLFEGELDAAPLAFTASPLTAESLTNEKIIQKVVFENPGLIPMEEIDPGAGAVAPLCRELALRGAGGSVFLDMIGVTRRGRLVLVECKLWRNGQARREVIGQILEYAALVGRLSYGDLGVLVGQKMRRTGPNVLWDLVKDRLGLTDEAAFVDAVTRSLETTDFDLIILGDGIRSEVEVVRRYLEGAGLRSRLSLVEVNCWRDAGGRTLFVPKVALRTRVIEHHVSAPASSSSSAAFFDPLAPAEPREVSEAAQATRLSNRAFWQSFIDRVQFSHPDQPPPSHGGTNTVRMSMPIASAVAFRTRGSGGPNERLGIFVRFSGEDGKERFDAMMAQKEELEAEVGAALKGEWVANRNAWDISLNAPPEATADEASSLTWLLAHADRMVSAFRPRLAQLVAGPDGEED